MGPGSGQRFQVWRSKASWNAGVAQLVEHWICNPAVIGSNPIAGSALWRYKR